MIMSGSKQASAAILGGGFATYYVIAATAIYGIAGRLSGPNPRYRKLKLDNLPSLAAVEGGGSSATEGTEFRKEGRQLVRKLSFLKASEGDDGPNVFVNRTWQVINNERIKYALVGPLVLPFRVCLLFGSLLGAWSFGSISIIGANLDKPLPWWRILLQKPMKYYARGIMLALGYHWITVKGKPATAAQAPIVVSNHIGFVEAIYLPSILLSMAISRMENKKIPIFGALMQQLQCIFVSRTDRDSRSKVAHEIERRTKQEQGQGWRQLLIFPEGTTTNGGGVISFKVGAFAAGATVQPVTVRYPSNNTLDNSWVTAGPLPQELLFRLLCLFNNSMEVHFLDPYVPNVQELKNPLLYAENVRKVMAQDLGVECTSHSFDDVLLLIEAKKLGYQGSLKNCVLKMKELRKFLEVDLDAAKQYLVDFSKLDNSKRGLLSYQEFIKAFKSKDTEEMRSLFSLLDVNDDGAISYSEYLTGLALLNEQGTDKVEGALNLIFKTFDSSNRGRLTQEETIQIFRRLFADVSEDGIKELFDAADTDHDGTLDASEFLKFAKERQDMLPKLKAILF